MNIRRAILPAVLSLLICGLSVLSSHAAGQVVTQDARDWAKKTLAGEKALTVTPSDNTMVILYFINLTGRSELNPLEKGMTLMLLTDLSQVPGLELIERVKLQALVEELKLGRSGLVDQQTAPRIGKLVGARWITGGDFAGGKQESFDTRSRLLDVASSAVAGQFSVAGTLDDILKTEKDLVFTIVDQLKISLKPEVAAAIRKPCSTNLKALDALFRGVDASDRGEYQQAGELYSEAIKEDPDVCVAGIALQELVRMGGYSERAASSRMKIRAVKAADAFNPKSALEDTATSVSGQTSLTGKFTDRNMIDQPVSRTTPVTIRVNFP